MLELPKMGMRRAYSIVEQRGNDITLLIKKQGAFTQKLFEARVGEEVQVSGPYGHFIITPEDQPLVMVAGGIGITPLYSIIMAHLHDERSSEVHLFYSSRRQDEMALLRRLQELRDERFHPHLRFTQEEGTRINAKELQAHATTGSEYYLCGPRTMITQIKEELIEGGVAAGNIRTEAFG